MLGSNMIMGKKKIDATSMDRISALPNSILHDILFFLPAKEAARTCILSKSWNQLVWSSLPVISFDFDQGSFFGKNRVLCIEERQVEFINLVEDSLQRLHSQRFIIRKFRLRIAHFDSKIASSIDRWLDLAANNYVQKLYLTILTSEKDYIWYNFPKIAFAATTGTLNILSLRGCKLQQNSLFDDDNDNDERARTLFLKKLYLVNVVTDNQDGFMQNFISRCPFIKHFRILRCLGMKNLLVSNHPELKKIKVDLRSGNGELDMLERIEVDVLNLETLDYSGDYDRPLVVHATRCRNLRHLIIKFARIEDHLLQNLVSYFPLLETLALHRCEGLKRIRISSHSALKKLDLHYNRHLVELAVIDTPSLLSFSLSNNTIPKQMFSINAASPSLLLLATRVLFPAQDLNTLWFLKLRDFLGQVNKHNLYMCLRIYTPAYEFIAEELREISFPDPPYEIDHLSLENRRPLLSYAAFVDGLLWSCHPKTLSVSSSLNSNNDFIKFMCEVLIEREEEPVCCNSCQSKCWRHYLKDVMIDRIDRTKDATTTNHSNDSFKSLLPTLATCKEVVFRLRWI